MAHTYYIKTEIRLSIALRYFAGGSVYDIMVSHGVSAASVFLSVWGVVDVINNHPNFKLEFPSHAQQEVIAKSFEKKSGAQFSKVIGAIDGILIWTHKPYKSECLAAKCGEVSFHCSRKGKYGWNMQAICDNKLRFYWIDLRWPGRCSDYMAWVTSALSLNINTSEKTSSPLIKKGYSIFGDNAYLKTHHTTVPMKGHVSEAEDAFNFFQSQLRISIECAFGLLVHRWAILRTPLRVPLFKVAPLVYTLVVLHNFYINQTLKKKRNSKL